MTTSDSRRRHAGRSRRSEVRALLRPAAPLPAAGRTPTRRSWPSEGRDRAALVLLFPLHRVGPRAPGSAGRARARRPLHGQPARRLARRAGPGPPGRRRVRRPGQPVGDHRRRARRAAGPLRRARVAASRQLTADWDPTPTSPPSRGCSAASSTTWSRPADRTARTGLRALPSPRTLPREGPDDPDHRPRQRGRPPRRPRRRRRARRQRRCSPTARS